MIKLSSKSTLLKWVGFFFSIVVFQKAAGAVCEISPNVFLSRVFHLSFQESSLNLINSEEGSSTIYFFDQFLEHKPGQYIISTPRANLFTYRSPPEIYYEVSAFKQLPEFKDGLFNKSKIVNDTLIVAVWRPDGLVDFSYLIFEQQSEETVKILNETFSSGDSDRFVRTAVRRSKLLPIGSGQCRK